MKTLIKTTVICSLILLISSNALANFNRKVIDSLLEHGSKSIKKNTPIDAINDFSKALILSPDNIDASIKLLELAQSPYLPTALKVKLLQFEDLYNYNLKLKNNIEFYAQKKSSLELQLASYGINKENLNEGLSELKNANNLDADLSADKISSPSDTTDSLSILIVELSNKKAFLEQDALLAKSEFEFLQNILKDYLSKKDNQILNESRSQKHQNISFTIAESENIMYTPEKSSLVEIAKLKENLIDLRITLKSKEDSIKNLSQQIVDTTLRLVEAENYIDNKASKSAELNLEINDLNSRIELGQKILQEKNNEIQILQNDLNSLKFQNATFEITLKNTVKEKNQEIVEQNGILQIYKEKYWEAYKKNKNFVDNLKQLEAQLKFAQKVLFEKEKSISRFKNSIIGYEEMLVGAEKELEEISLMYDSSSDQYVTLKHNIELLQSHLEVLREDLKTQLNDFNNVYSTFANNNYFSINK